MSNNLQAQVTITVTETGDGNSGGVTTTFTVSQANGGRIRTNLGSGRSQIQPDNGVTFTTVLMIPDPSSVVAKTWDAAGAVGGALHPSQPTLISVPATSSVYVNAASADSNFRAYFW